VMRGGGGGGGGGWVGSGDAVRVWWRGLGGSNLWFACLPRKRAARGVLAAVAPSKCVVPLPTC
jgi:hypothetical protein